jgi:hypothetical protein
MIEIVKGTEGPNPLSLTQENEPNNGSNFYEPTIVTDSLWFPDIAIRQDDLLNELSEEQKFGNAFHMVMANCDTIEEIQNTVEKLIIQDIIPENYRGDILQKATVFFQKISAIFSFDHSSKVLNEKSLIVSEDSIKRPDKLILNEKETIVIDFKTGIEKTKDEKQIREYATVLKEMNLPEVKAFLFYTSNEELKEIAC